MWQILLVVLVCSCTKRNQEVCCETADECAAIETDQVVACKVGVCVEHECVNPGPCDGIEDCDASDTCVDGMCTPPPIPPDAPLVAAFDVAYPNVWRFSVAGPVGISVMFINTSVNPFSTSTLEVRELSDDHPTAFIRLTASPSLVNIPPGFAGGKIAPIAEPFLTDSGLVSEPRTDTDSSYVGMELVDAPSGTYDIAVGAVLGLDGLDVPLNMTIHVVPGPIIAVDPRQVREPRSSDSAGNQRFGS
ncbi:MAG: hypothetical protein H0V17_07835 [Deltaproteobacteria bacterium]|nr:hypothetical protein [Deltaproteobacteria bacterium]